MSEITLEGIARRCIDQALTTSEIAYLLETQAELGRLRRDSTLVECSNPACKRGVRNEYSVCGLCVPCAEEELARLRYAVKSWLAEEVDWKAEEKRLRGIEAAVLYVPVYGAKMDPRHVANNLRAWANSYDLSRRYRSQMAAYLFRIADALEGAE